MKMRNKIAAAALAAVMAMSVTACGNAGGASSAVAEGSAASGKQMITIGVSQLVTHPSLDASLKGFQQALADAGYVEGQNVTYDIQNAQGEQANCVTIANTFANKKPDLILAIGTPAAQAVAKVITDTPILVTAVTDPADAKLVASNEKPGGNVSGTSDKTPVKEQIQMLKTLVPNMTTVGFLYSSSETNSKLQIEWAKAACAELGLKYQEFTASSSNEVQQVTQSMVGKVQGVYIPTDNLMASSMKNVTSVTTANKLPVVPGAIGMVTDGGTCTVGINYEKLGYQSGQMAIKVLKGEAKVSDMPIEYQDTLDVYYNSEMAAKLGLVLPESITKNGQDAVSPAASSQK
ncbi:ABC transporter substrate-binding protein [Faecalispora anaeroviscerum]|uniref:ABC transporter substrate-binding protein n=1 Tax=Faecalispora anaeroviscerum TaxID=2991836 RepID=UPI0024BA8132|nr:ABC transporter substrate-binding protein [Faecalispora anaeroviscerum]